MSDNSEDGYELPLSRRRFTQLASTTGAAALAGCTGDEDGDPAGGSDPENPAGGSEDDDPEDDSEESQDDGDADEDADDGTDEDEGDGEQQESDDDGGGGGGFGGGGSDEAEDDGNELRLELEEDSIRDGERTAVELRLDRVPDAGLVRYTIDVVVDPAVATVETATMDCEILSGSQYDLEEDGRVRLTATDVVGLSGDAEDVRVGTVELRGEEPGATDVQAEVDAFVVGDADGDESDDGDQGETGEDEADDVSVVGAELSVTADGFVDTWFRATQTDFSAEQYQWNPAVGWFIPHDQFGMFAQLAQYKIGEGEFEPHLIEDWEHHPAAGRSVFTLSEAFTWGSGDSITADDLVFQLEIMEAADDPIWRFVDDADATGEYELTLRYPAGTNPDLIEHAFLEELARFPPENWEGTNWEESPTDVEITEPDSSGPLHLTEHTDEYSQTEPREGLADVADHHLADRFNWNGYRVEFRDGLAQAHESFVAGDVDGQHSLFTPPDVLEQFPDALEEVRIPGGFGMALWFNHDREPWNQREVRQALLYSLDRGAIVEAVGESTVASHHPAPTGLTWASVDDWLGSKQPDGFTTYEQDLQQAETLLEEAGHAMEDIEVEIRYPQAWSDWATMGQTIVDQLNAAGWDATGVPFTEAVGSVAGSGDFDLITDQHTLGGAPRMQYPFFSLDYVLRNRFRAAESHFANYPSEVEIDGETIDVHATLDDLETATDPDRKAELVETLARVVNEDVPCAYVTEKYEQSFIDAERFEIPDPDGEHAEQFQTYWPMWWLPKVDETMEGQDTPGLMKANPDADPRGSGLPTPSVDLQAEDPVAGVTSTVDVSIADGPVSGITEFEFGVAVDGDAARVVGVDLEETPFVHADDEDGDPAASDPGTVHAVVPDDQSVGCGGTQLLAQVEVRGSDPGLADVRVTNASVQDGLGRPRSAGSAQAEVQVRENYFQAIQTDFSADQYQWNPLVGWFVPHDQFGMFAQLAQYKIGEGEFEPHLIEDWEHAPADGESVFTLSEAFTWGSGDDVTAEDLVFQLDILEAADEPIWRFVDDAEATGEYELTLSYPAETNPDLVEHALLEQMAQFPPENWEGTDWQDAPADVEVPEPDSSGPLALTDHTETYSQTQPRAGLDDTADHHLADHYDWTGYRVQFRDGNAQAHQSFIAGEVDGQHSLFVPPQILDEFPDHVQQVQIPGGFGMALWFNHDREPWDQREVRQALLHSLDRGAIVEAVGESTKVSHHPAPTGLTWSSVDDWLGSKQPDGFTTYERDLQQAEALLEEAGHAMEEIEVAIRYPQAWSDWATMGQVIVEQLNEAGWDATGVPFTEALGSVAGSGDFDLITDQHTLGGAPRMHHPYFSLDHVLRNRIRDTESHFANYPTEIELDGETIDVEERLDDLAATSDRTEQEAIVEQLARVVNEDVPCAYITEKYEQSFVDTERFDVPDPDSEHAEHLQTYWPMWWLPKVDETMEGYDTPGLMKANPLEDPEPVDTTPPVAEVQGADLDVGETAVLAVSLEDVPNSGVREFEFDVGTAGDAATVDGVRFVGTEFVRDESDDPGDGDVIGVSGVTPDGEPVESDGATILATVEVRALEPGSSVLELHDVTVRDGLDREHSLGMTSASIQVDDIEGVDEEYFRAIQTDFSAEQYQWNPLVGWFIPHDEFGMFAQLAQYKIGEGEFEPHLIEDWEHASATGESVFTLSEAFTWSSGEPITAEDLVFQLEILEADDVDDTIWRFVDDAEATGEYELTLSYPAGTNPDLVEYTLLEQLAQFPPENWEGTNWEEAPRDVDVAEPESSGPLHLTDHTDRYSQTEPRDGLDDAADHHLADHYDWSGYRVEFRDGLAQAHQSFVAGDVDGQHSLHTPPDVLEQFPDDYREFRIPGGFGMALWFNHDRAPWDQREVRQALLYSLDRSAIVETVGESTKVSHHPAPTGLTWSSVDDWLGSKQPDGFTTYERDLQQAEALLEEAGYAMEDITVEVQYPQAWSDWATMGQAIVDQLNAAGWDAKGVPFREALGAVAGSGDFDVIADQHTLGGAPRVHHPFFSLDYVLRNRFRDADGHFANYPSEVELDGETIDVEARLDDLAATSDRTEQEAIVEQLARVVNEDVPCAYITEKYEQSFVDEGRFEMPDPDSEHAEHFQTYWPMWWLPKVDETMEGYDTPGLLKRTAPTDQTE